MIGLQMLWNCKDYRLLAVIICEVGLSEQLQKQRGEAGHSPVGGRGPLGLPALHAHAQPAGPREGARELAWGCLRGEPTLPRVGPRAP